MKKILLTILSIIILTLTGCVQQETYDNGVPTYFIEPDGYIIAEVEIDDNSLFNDRYYGYILECDYNDFLLGNFDKPLVILHPYEQGKSVTVNSKQIISINIGIYKDVRYR